jgi:hypothetical protein
MMQESDVFGSSSSCGCLGKCKVNAINTSKFPLGHPSQYMSDHFQVHNNFFQLFVVKLWLARTFEAYQKSGLSIIHGLQKWLWGALALNEYYNFHYITIPIRAVVVELWLAQVQPGNGWK